MPSRSGTRERPRIEPNADPANKSPLNAGDSLRFHWPEYLMEAGESGLYLFCACTFATLLWHPVSPIHGHLPSDTVRRILMGLAMGATIIAIVLSPWGKQSGAHFNPAVTFTFYRLRKVALWDAVFYCAMQFLGAVGGVALASLVLQGAPAHRAIRYAATIPGIYGDTIAFESPISGMSTNPARTFGPALFAGYRHAIWIYFIGPPLGMLAAADSFPTAWDPADLAAEMPGVPGWMARARSWRRCIGSTVGARSDRGLLGCGTGSRRGADR